MADPNVYQGPGSGGTHHSYVNVVALGVDNSGVADAGAQFNAISGALAKSGQTAWFPAGTYNFITAVTYVFGLNPLISPDANFIGPNASSMHPIAVPPKIMFLGDSNTFGNDGVHTGMVGGYATYAVQYLRTLRSDFDVIGSLVALAENAALSSLPYNEGHSGATIASTAAAYAGYCASPGVGPPDIVVLMIGTNDLQAGRTLAQMQADTLTLYNAILAVNPLTSILWMGPPPLVDGTLTHANLAAWNAQLAAYNTWLQFTFIPANRNALYNVSSRSVGNGDFQVDGVHLNQGGQGTVGVSIARDLNQNMGPPRSDVMPSVFNTRKPSYSVFVNGEGTADDIALVAHPGFNPGAGSFTLAFDYCPTTMFNSGGLSVVRYGANGVNNYYQIFVASNPNAGGGLSWSVYWMQAGNVIPPASFAGSPGAFLNQWHRLVIMADAATLTVGFYVNGKLAGLAHGLPAWTSAQENLRFGDSVVTNGAPGYYSRVYAAQAVPGRPGSMAALLAAEEDYYLGRSLVPGQGTAFYSLDNTLADDVYAPGEPNPVMVLQGAAAFVPGYPVGSPARPWEIHAELPPLAPPAVNIAITTPTTGNMTLTGQQAQNEIIPIAMTLTGDVTVIIPVPGEYHFDISAVVYAAHNLFFKYGTATSPAITAVSLSADLAIVVAGAQGPNTIAVNF